MKKGFGSRRCSRAWRWWSAPVGRDVSHRGTIGLSRARRVGREHGAAASGSAASAPLEGNLEIWHTYASGAGTE